MTQEQVAAVLGISSNYYARLERGVTTMRPHMIEQLASHYGVKPADLIEDSAANTQAQTAAIRIQRTTEDGVIKPQVMAILEALPKLSDDKLNHVLEFVRFQSSSEQKH